MVIFVTRRDRKMESGEYLDESLRRTCFVYGDGESKKEVANRYFERMRVRRFSLHRSIQKRLDALLSCSSALWKLKSQSNFEIVDEMKKTCIINDDSHHKLKGAIAMVMTTKIKLNKLTDCQRNISDINELNLVRDKEAVEAIAAVTSLEVALQQVLHKRLHYYSKYRAGTPRAIEAAAIEIPHNIRVISEFIKKNEKTELASSGAKIALRLANKLMTCFYKLSFGLRNVYSEWLQIPPKSLLISTLGEVEDYCSALLKFAEHDNETLEHYNFVMFLMHSSRWHFGQALDYYNRWQESCCGQETHSMSFGETMAMRHGRRWAMALNLVYLMSEKMNAQDMAEDSKRQLFVNMACFKAALRMGTGMEEHFLHSVWEEFIKIPEISQLQSERHSSFDECLKVISKISIIWLQLMNDFSKLESPSHHVLCEHVTLTPQSGSLDYEDQFESIMEQLVELELSNELKLENDRTLVENEFRTRMMQFIFEKVKEQSIETLNESIATFLTRRRKIFTAHTRSKMIAGINFLDPQRHCPEFILPTYVSSFMPLLETADCSHLSGIAKILQSLSQIARTSRPPQPFLYAFLTGCHLHVNLARFPADSNATLHYLQKETKAQHGVFKALFGLSPDVEAHNVALQHYTNFKFQACAALLWKSLHTSKKSSTTQARCAELFITTLLTEMICRKRRNPRKYSETNREISVAQALHSEKVLFGSEQLVPVLMGISWRLYHYHDDKLSPVYNLIVSYLLSGDMKGCVILLWKILHAQQLSGILKNRCVVLLYRCVARITLFHWHEDSLAFHDKINTLRQEIWKASEHFVTTFTQKNEDVVEPTSFDKTESSYQNATAPADEPSQHKQLRSTPDNQAFEYGFCPIIEKSVITVSGGELAIDECTITFPESSVTENTKMSMSLEMDFRKVTIPENLAPISGIVGVDYEGDLGEEVTFFIPTWFIPADPSEKIKILKSKQKVDGREVFEHEFDTDWNEGYLEFKSNHFCKRCAAVSLDTLHSGSLSLAHALLHNKHCDFKVIICYLQPQKLLEQKIQDAEKNGYKKIHSEAFDLHEDECEISLKNIQQEKPYKFYPETHKVQKCSLMATKNKRHALRNAVDRNFVLPLTPELPTYVHLEYKVNGGSPQPFTATVFPPSPQAAMPSQLHFHGPQNTNCDFSEFKAAGIGQVATKSGQVTSTRHATNENYTIQHPKNEEDKWKH